METTGLKALANKVLQRNQQGNSRETHSFHDRKLEGVKVSTRETQRKPYPIPFNTLWRMFKDSLKRIEKVYSPIIWDTGLMDTPEYRKAWDRLNDIAIACLEGRAELKEYQDTLKEWQRVVGYTPMLGG